MERRGVFDRHTGVFSVSPWYKPTRHNQENLSVINIRVWGRKVCVGGMGGVIQIVFGEVRGREVAIDRQGPHLHPWESALRHPAPDQTRWVAPPAAGRLPGVRRVKPRMERMQNLSAKCQQSCEMSCSGREKSSRSLQLQRLSFQRRTSCCHEFAALLLHSGCSQDSVLISMHSKYVPRNLVKVLVYRHTA